MVASRSAMAMKWPARVDATIRSAVIASSPRVVQRYHISARPIKFKGWCLYLHHLGVLAATSPATKLEPIAPSQPSETPMPLNTTSCPIGWLATAQTINATDLGIDLTNYEATLHAQLASSIAIATLEAHHAHSLSHTHASESAGRGHRHGECQWPMCRSSREGTDRHVPMAQGSCAQLRSARTAEERPHGEEQRQCGPARPREF